MIDIQTISRLAVEAMLSEVSATPKPGLVDRHNCGAHHDMDFFTFVSSSAALSDAYRAMGQVGIDFGDQEITDMWPMLQSVGYEMEQRMFESTKNVNTHKGMVFSLGILSACAGWLSRQKNIQSITATAICGAAAQLCAGLCEKAFKDMDQKTALTKGDRMYLAYGLRGARGEAEDGFPTVMTVALPMYTLLRDTGISINDALVETLLHLVAHTEDTNIVSRHDWDTATYAKEAAKRVIRLGGIHTEVGRAAIEAMDQDFIERYISPGGAADLLALTHFLYEIEKVG